MSPLSQTSPSSSRHHACNKNSNPVGPVSSCVLAACISVMFVNGGDYNQMKRRFTQAILKLHQNRVIATPSPHLHSLHQESYRHIANMISDITRPFKNICVHGRYADLALRLLAQHNQRFNLQPKDYNVTVVDFVRNPAHQQLYEQQKVREVRYMETSDMWLPEEDRFDLLISCLHTHHANSEQELLRRYNRSLQPDGALVGCALVEGTLHQLYWAYLMAQNERYGGMSPKVTQFGQIGQFGTSMTECEYKIANIMAYDYICEMESFGHLLTMVQEMGESGYLRGRRKGVYKELMMAANALYQSQFPTQNGGIEATVSMISFIGWKFAESQQKALRPGPAVGGVAFAEELRQYGQVESWEVGEGMEDAVSTTPKKDDQ